MCYKNGTGMRVMHLPPNLGMGLQDPGPGDKAIYVIVCVNLV